MRKLLLLAALCLMLAGSVFAAGSSITDMKTDCRVDPDGSCHVTQTFTLDLQSLEHELRFPVGENAENAQIAGIHTRKTSEDDVLMLRVLSDTGFTGMRTFTMTYDLDGIITEQDGIQTLTLPLLSGRWNWSIEHYSFTVSMPQTFDAAPHFLSGYQGDVIEGYLTLHTDETMIHGNMNLPLKDRESLKMTMELPAGYFTGAYAKWSANRTLTVLIVLLCAGCLLYWLLTLRSVRLQSGARTTAPDSVHPGDVPFLLCCGASDFNMMLCHWAALGYLSISVSAGGNVTLRRRVEMGNERRRIECKLFDMLFAGEDVCDGASLRYKSTAQKAMQVIPRFWMRRLYTRDSGNPVIMSVLCALAGAVAMLMTMSMVLPVMTARGLLLTVFFVLGAALSLLIQRGVQRLYLPQKLWPALAAVCAAAMLLLGQLGGGFWGMLCAVSLSVLTGHLTRHGGKRTELGSQLVGQTLGFRKYLRRATDGRTELMLRRDAQYFYKMLPYAEAMGIGAEFAEKFGDAELEPCDWYTEAQPIDRHASDFYRRWKETLTLLNISIRQ